MLERLLSRWVALNSTPSGEHGSVVGLAVWLELFFK